MQLAPALTKAQIQTNPLEGCVVHESNCITYIKPGNVNIVCCKLTVPLFNMGKGGKKHQDNETKTIIRLSQSLAEMFNTDSEKTCLIE